MIFTPLESPIIGSIKGVTIGVTSGCFDLLHFYHLHLLERCRAQCDLLFVGVDSDELVHTNKNKWPVNPEFHRVQMVNALKCVDGAFVMRSIKDLERVCSSGFAAKLFKNSPHIYGEPVIQMPGVEIVIIPDVQELTSTSAIIDKIRSI